MSRKTCHFRRLAKQTENIYDLIPRGAKGNGTWLGDGKVRGRGNRCTFPMSQEKAKRMLKVMEEAKSPPPDHRRRR